MVTLLALGQKAGGTAWEELGILIMIPQKSTYRFPLGFLNPKHEL